MNALSAWSAGLMAVFLTGMGAAWAEGVSAPSVSPPVPPGINAETSGERFTSMRSRLVAGKARIQRQHEELLRERYDLRDDPAPGLTMTRGKPVQRGIRVRLAAGATWERLGQMTPEAIRGEHLFPAGFLPLPHPNHPEGGMVFPRLEVEEIRRQEGRDLSRFDLDYDFPDHLLPEFPPAMFLTTRGDLGDVSQGRLVTMDNYYEMFEAILNPKQLEGLRLLLTPFPQQQFNQTGDRRSDRPSRGVACFDCHANGHANGATHLAGDVRPQELRHRIDTTSLRGLSIQRLFGSQRALKSVEDFTEFEQRAAYFDGDPILAAKKGVNPLERGSQVQFMAEFQELLDFPPAPKLGVLGTLIPSMSTEQELRGEALFQGKARCSVCHPAPYFTDNSMHNLQVERFFESTVIQGRRAGVDGPIKTFTLRGIRESPPYLHDGRLLTLEDTIEFFNLILETRLSVDEKADLLAYLRVL